MTFNRCYECFEGYIPLIPQEEKETSHWETYKDGFESASLTILGMLMDGKTKEEVSRWIVEELGRYEYRDR